MGAAATVSQCPAVSDTVQTGFLAILPHVLAHARARFHHLPCAGRRADLAAEAVALAWVWYGRLKRRGKDPGQFVVAFSRLAARAVWNGRRLCGQDKAGDALSPLTHRRQNFAVYSLPVGSSAYGSSFDEALQDNAQTPVPDQVAFRLDFPAWLRTRPRRDRRLIAALMDGERTLDVAHQHGLSPSRVSQLRREFLDDWRTFCGEGRLPMRCSSTGIPKRIPPCHPSDP